MKWDQFNQQIKGDVQNHSSAIDIDELWNAIEPEVDLINAHKRKKKGLLFWLSLSGVLITGIFAYTMFGFQPSAKTDVLTNESLISVSDIKEEKSKLAPLQEKTATSVISDDNQLAQNKKSAATKGSTSLAGNTSKKAKPVSVQPKKNTAKIKTQVAKVPLKVQSNFTTNTTDLISSKEVVGKVKETKASGITAPTTKVTDPILSSETILKPKPVQLSILELEYLFDEQNLPSLDLPDVTNEFDLLKKSKAKDFGRRRNRDRSYGIHLTGGASIARKQLSAMDSVGVGLLPIRRDSETSLETSHFGVMFDMQTKSGWGLATGLERTKINERYDYETITETTTFIEGVEFQQIEFNGDTTDIIGTLPQTTTVKETKQFYNSYTMYDIPLLISFHQETNDFFLGIRAGVYVNVAMSAQGRIADGINSDINIEEMDPKIFKSSVGVSYYLGMSIRKPLFENLELSFAPAVRFYPKNFGSAVNPVAQKYVLFGGNIGIGYRF